MNAGVDFGDAADDYARHRAGFPASAFDALATRGIGLSGQRIVDLGTGTGTLARGFAERGAKSLGLDPSSGMLGSAHGAAFARGRAEELPLATASCDAVTAGQCWHWFDGPRAARECRRVLRPGGWLAVIHFDYLALETVADPRGNPAGLTEELIERYHPGWEMAGADGRYERWRPHLEQAGFEALATFEQEVPVRYTQAAWRGRVRACNGVLAIPTARQRRHFDAELAAALHARWGKGELLVPHRVWALLARA